MPWLETNPVTERKSFIMEWLSGEFGIAGRIQQHEFVDPDTRRPAVPARAYAANLYGPIDVIAEPLCDGLALLFNLGQHQARYADDHRKKYGDCREQGPQHAGKTFP